MADLHYKPEAALNMHRIASSRQKAQGLYMDEDRHPTLFCKKNLILACQM